MQERVRFLTFSYMFLRTFPTSRYFPMLNGEVENAEFSETSENIFPRFSPPSFPFCTMPKTENSEVKTSEIFSEAF